MLDPSIVDSFVLMLVLLNPFLLIIYLMDLVTDLSMKEFIRVLVRAAVISGMIYITFALIGERIFTHVFQSHFASFQVFGGIIFLITGTRFVFQGNKAMAEMRGKPEQVAGSIVMPIMTGPGTISASIIIGERLDVLSAITAILLALVLCVLAVILLKKWHDYVLPKNEKLVARYIDIIGRITALLIGTFSIEMLMSGIHAWIEVMQDNVPGESTIL